MSVVPICEERGAERWRVMLPAVIRRGQQRCDAVVTDLTSVGCRVQTDVLLNTGGYLLLALAGISELDAAVIWTRGAEAGLAFKPALHPAILDHIVRTNPPAEDEAGG